MSALTFACPYCGQHIVSDSSWEGRDMHCPNCDEIFLVPMVKSAPPPLPVGHAISPSIAQKASGPKPWVLIVALAAVVVVFTLLGIVGLFVSKKVKTLTDRPTPPQTLTQARFRTEPRRAPAPSTVPRTRPMVAPGPRPPLASTDLSGTVLSHPFRCDEAVLMGNVLTLRQLRPRSEVKVFLFAPPEALKAATNVVVSPEQSSTSPHIYFNGENGTSLGKKSGGYSSGYMMELQLQPGASGQMNGAVFLRLPEESATELNGKFIVAVR